jgi:purine nucleoside permease
VSIASLVHSPLFNFRHTYWLVSGVAGINPEVAGVGSVTFARFIAQPSLQYEFDAREKPDNYTTGYVPQGSTFPSDYPTEIYGTECYELNEGLRDLALELASSARLSDTADAAAFRATYANVTAYAPGASGPIVVACDTATADTYVSGRLLSETWQNYTRLITNGTGRYCTTAQEDTAVAEAILRADLAGLADYSRLMVMRSGSDYDRQAPETPAAENLYYGQSGYTPALANLHLAGVKVVQSIITDWRRTFRDGIKAPNYVGDILGTLGGEPDYGPGSVFGGVRPKSSIKRRARRFARRWD